MRGDSVSEREMTVRGRTDAYPGTEGGGGEQWNVAYLTTRWRLLDFIELAILYCGRL